MDPNESYAPQPGGAPPGRGDGGLSRRMATAVTATGLMVGGLAGGFLIAHAATSTGTSTPSSSSPSTGTTATTTPPAGTFHPNEDPTHESGESAAREAQENAGQRPTVP